MSSSLSDRLRQLAGDESEHTPLTDAPRLPHADRHPSSTTPTHHTSANSTLAVNLENTATHNSQSSRAKTSPKPTAHNHDQLKLIAVPGLITIGIFLLIPFVWAIMLLSGLITNERDDAHSMALLMLSTGPLALILIASAAFFYWQVKQNK